MLRYCDELNRQWSVIEKHINYFNKRSLEITWWSLLRCSYPLDCKQVNGQYIPLSGDPATL